MHRLNAKGVLGTYTWPPSGLSDLGLALHSVLGDFAALDAESTACGIKAIAVVTDSTIPYNSPSEYDPVVILSNASDTRAFLFTTGQGKNTEGHMAKVLACHTHGLWIPIEDAEAIDAQVSTFTNYFIKITGNRDSARVFWTEPYTYAGSSEVGITVATPIFHKSDAGSKLIGVAGIDTTLDYIDTLARGGNQDSSSARLHVFAAMNQQVSTHCESNEIALSQCELQESRFEAAGHSGLCLGQCTTFAPSRSDVPCLPTSKLPRVIWKHQYKWGTKIRSYERYLYRCCLSKCTPGDTRMCSHHYHDGTRMFDEVDISGDIIPELDSSSLTFKDRRCCVVTTPGTRGSPCRALDGADTQFLRANPEAKDRIQPKYVLIKSVISFETALARCKKTGGGLAEPKTKQARAEIQAIMDQAGVRHAYIGARSQRCNYKVPRSQKYFTGDIIGRWSTRQVVDFPCDHSVSPGEKDVDWLTVWSNWPHNRSVYDKSVSGGAGCNAGEKTFSKDMTSLYGKCNDVEHLHEVRNGGHKGVHPIGPN